MLKPRFLLFFCCKACLLLILLGLPCFSEKFYADDPLWKEPPPSPVKDVDPQRLVAMVDFYKNTVHKKGERHAPGRVIPSEGMNTLGELPDSTWYTNRHDRLRRMPIDELRRGPDVGGPPDASGQWTLTDAKAEGVTPGFTIKDAKGRRYLLKFDPLTNPEMATGAEVVATKFFYAIGYNVPENYVTYFTREQLNFPKGLKFKDLLGRQRELSRRDVDDMLRQVPVDSKGRYRALASRYLSGKPVGGFKYYKRREDDPNEIAAHEHLRVLRGMYVFAAWLNHTDAKALNSLDMVVEEDGRTFIRHYLIDFGSSLGSDSLWAKDPRLGHEFVLDWTPGAKYLATLGLAVPKYARVDYPDDPALGNFTDEAFDPDRWKSNYPNAAFANRLPGDEFWGAKKVMAFTDQEIWALAQEGRYTNPETARWLASIISKRRDAVGRRFFAKLLPVDNFRVEGGRLVFDDLAEVYGFRARLKYSLEWFRFDNQTGRAEPLAGATGDALPAAMSSGATGSYWGAKIRGEGASRTATVYLRKEASGWKAAGIEREGENHWEPR